MRQVLLTVLVLLSVLSGATATGPVAAQDDGLSPDGVRVHIDIHGDGDARWTIAATYDVNESADRRAFEDVAAEFERGQGELGFSIQTFERVVPQVADRADRQMAIQDPQWTSGIVNDSSGQQGALRLSFTWTNFAHVDNETVTLGGVFAGGWFGDLGEGQMLVIQPPPGFDVSSAQPSHETVNGTLRWTGPVAFGPKEPVATFQRQPASPDIPWASIAGALVTALVIGGIIAYAWVWRSSSDAGPFGGAPTESEETGETPDGGADAGTATATDPDLSVGDAAGDTEADAGETGAGGTEVEATPELLSDEERVERLLEAQGGRMKQARIVEETRWSNAKVSQLLSQMAEDGRVEKLRIGRENLISLPAEEDEDSPR
jgi:hypothetical protein